MSPLRLANDRCYRVLFLAAGGGGLGLFTAISRLKQVYRRIAGPLDPMMPSRLAGAFPEGVELRRVGLAEAVAGTRAFFAGREGRGPQMNADQKG